MARNCFVKRADPHTSLLYVHMGTIILSNKSIGNLIVPPEYLLVWLRRVYIAMLAIFQSCCMFASNFPLLEITVPKYVRLAFFNWCFLRINNFPQIGEIVFSQPWVSIYHSMLISFWDNFGDQICFLTLELDRLHTIGYYSLECLQVGLVDKRFHQKCR